MSERPALRHYLGAYRALVAARLAVVVLPSRRFFMAPPPAGDPASEDEIALVRRTLYAASRRLPLRIACFERGLAARRLLARRGRTSTLHFGGTKYGGSLSAHVWLKSGDRFVVGEEEADAAHIELAATPRG